MLDADLVIEGETIRRVVRLTREDIALFAQMSHDANPLHLNRSAAERAQFPDVIASGQQTAALLMGLMATHFTRSSDGIEREMLCLNTNFAYKLPVLADQDLLLQWRVTSVRWNTRLRGQLVQLDGSAVMPPASTSAVVARGTIMVRRVQSTREISDAA
jgi:acyl dehydratase